MLNETIQRTLQEVARFYDERKVGDSGSLGFRRSSDLGKLLACLECLLSEGLVVPGRSLFLDMGCGDGRVNVLFGYIVRLSFGIELDEWILDEYSELRALLDQELREQGFPLPPDNIFLFNGNALDEASYRSIGGKTGIYFHDFDIFYTYLTMQDEFADLIVQKAKKGSIFMVYGLNSILPKYKGMRLLTPFGSLKGILALYQKM
ncbi:MAG: hypothetical protein JRJ29_07720 [Deltaproteobacteria bacterium]|nr:hypothetical protein [Deltaproteobacteria bacterium]